MLINYIASLELGLISGYIALGTYTTFRITKFTDLTCDGTVIIGAATTAALLQAGVSPALATLIAVLAGGLTGLSTGIVSTYLNIPRGVSGILVALAAYSVSLHIMGGSPNIPLTEQELLFDQSNQLLVIVSLTAMFCVAFVYFLATRTGIYMHIAGHNPALAQQIGFNPLPYTLLGVSLSNAIIALGASLFVHYQQFADISQGFGSLITGLSAALLGEKILPKKPYFFPVLGCFFGGVLYQLFLSVALNSTWLGLEPYDMNLVLTICMVMIMLERRSR